MKDEQATVQTMGVSTHDSIEFRGLDLTSELLGKVTFTDGLFLSIVGRLPEGGERDLLDAVLVTLMDHGTTANSLATRLTFHAAPDAVQGAMAAGLLGAGSRLLGAVEGTAKLLQHAFLQPVQGREEWLRSRLTQLRNEGERVSGLGHFMHTAEDPRTTTLRALSSECGYGSEYWNILDELCSIAQEVYGREFVVNADGAIGAVLSEMGFDWRICRGFAVVARSAGLLGHIQDEIASPTAWAVWQAAEQEVPYRRPEIRFKARLTGEAD